MACPNSPWVIAVSPRAQPFDPSNHLAEHREMPNTGAGPFTEHEAAGRDAELALTFHADFVNEASRSLFPALA